MAESLNSLAKGALKDLEGVFAAMPESAPHGLIDEIVKAKRIVVFGLGREGLQMRGFAMRLFHMGRNARCGATCARRGPRGPALRLGRSGQSRDSRALVGWPEGAGPHGASSPPSPRASSPPRRRRDRHPGADHGRRPRRPAFGLADGFAVRDGRDDRLRIRDPQPPPGSARRRRRCGPATRISNDGGRPELAGLKGLALNSLMPHLAPKRVPRQVTAHAADLARSAFMLAVSRHAARRQRTRRRLPGLSPKFSRRRRSQARSSGSRRERPATRRRLSARLSKRRLPDACSTSRTTCGSQRGSGLTEFRSPARERRSR